MNSRNRSPIARALHQFRLSVKAARCTDGNLMTWDCHSAIMSGGSDFIPAVISLRFIPRLQSRRHCWRTARKSSAPDNTGIVTDKRDLINVNVMQSVIVGVKQFELSWRWRWAIIRVMWEEVAGETLTAIIIGGAGSRWRSQSAPSRSRGHTFEHISKLTFRFFSLPPRTRKELPRKELLGGLPTRVASPTAS